MGAGAPNLGMFSYHFPGWLQGIRVLLYLLGGWIQRQYLQLCTLEIWKCEKGTSSVDLRNVRRTLHLWERFEGLAVSYLLFPSLLYPQVVGVQLGCEIGPSGSIFKIISQ